jgi:hypothetical protein
MPTFADTIQDEQCGAVPSPLGVTKLQLNNKGNKEVEKGQQDSSPCNTGTGNAEKFSSNGSDCITGNGNVEFFSSNGSGEISSEQQDSPCSGMAEDYDLLATAFESIKDTNDVHSDFDMVRQFFKSLTFESIFVISWRQPLKVSRIRIMWTLIL